MTPLDHANRTAHAQQRIAALIDAYLDVPAPSGGADRSRMSPRLRRLPEAGRAPVASTGVAPAVQVREAAPTPKPSEREIPDGPGRGGFFGRSPRPTTGNC